MQILTILYFVPVFKCRVPSQFQENSYSNTLTSDTSQNEAGFPNVVCLCVFLFLQNIKLLLLNQINSNTRVTNIHKLRFWSYLNLSLIGKEFETYPKGKQVNPLTTHMEQKCKQHCVLPSFSRALHHTETRPPSSNSEGLIYPTSLRREAGGHDTGACTVCGSGVICGVN